MFAYIILLLAVYMLFTFEVTTVGFLFAALTLMLYIVPYFTLWDDFVRMHLVSEKGGVDFFFFIFSSFVCFIGGCKIFDVVSKGKPVIAPVVTSIDLKKYEKYSMVAGVIGIMGYGYFMYRSGASYYMGHMAGDFSVGGYVYELRYFIFSAFLLLFQLYLSKTLSKRGLYFLIGIFLFLAHDAYVQQQRGSWIRFGVIILLSYLFHNAASIRVNLVALMSRYKKIFALGFVFFLLLTLTLQIRKFYTPQGSFATQISKTFSYIIEKPEVLLGGSGIDEGNEFVTAYNAYRSNVVAKGYDYGYKWLYPFINFIPRKLWKNKPTWTTFSNDVFATMDKFVVKGHTQGSAETGIIDAFYRFLYFTPLFFLFCGYYTQRLHHRAKTDFSSRLFYICFFVGCFYFITQNMMPLIIFTLYMYIPVWAVVKLSCRKVAAT